MVFGFFIDVPIVVGGYFLMLRYRGQLSALLTRTKLPALATCMLLSVPLIIVEEQIDCMPAWCGTVIIPPTIPFLLVEIFALALISLKLRAKNAFRVASLYSVFGVFFEASVGGLAGAGLLITLIFAPYVWVGYGFISLLPVSVLIANRHSTTRNPNIPALAPAAKPGPVGSVQ